MLLLRLCKPMQPNQPSAQSVKHPHLAVLALLCACVAAPGALASAPITAPRVTAGLAVPALPDNPSRPAEAPTRLAIESSLAQDGPEAALDLAQRAVTASLRRYGADDGRLAIPLIQRAHVRQAGGDASGALIDYRRAIALAEATGGPRDARLSAAWYGLGYLHLASGQAAAASSALATALQLHRLNHGLYSAGQLDVLQALAVSARAAGADDQADQWQIRRIEVGERVHAKAPLLLAQVYLSAGRWFGDAGRSGNAISLHALAVQTLDNNGGREQPALFEPLLELALSAGQRRREFDQASLPPKLRPQTTLSRAEHLLEAEEVDARAAITADPATLSALAARWIRLGDVHLILGRSDDAETAYARALQLRASAGAPSSDFEQPAFLQFQPPLPLAASRDGRLVAEFDVDTRGRTLRPRIVERLPEDLPTTLDAALLQALRGARLRPALRQGKPVASEGVRFELQIRGDSA